MGADVYDMYPVVDTIAHEYSTGGMSASRTPLVWFQDMIGMYSFRAFAGAKPSWMLSYSWEKEKKIAPAEAMQNLAMAQLMAGTNTWDAQGHVMSESNDIQTRTAIFEWIKVNEKTFFLPRQPVRPIGIYFSQPTRNYFADEFIKSYRGFLMLLLQSHLEFQIVTPRTLKSFQGEMLILPDARCLSTVELESLHSYRASGKTLIVAKPESMMKPARCEHQIRSTSCWASPRPRRRSSAPRARGSPNTQVAPAKPTLAHCRRSSTSLLARGNGSRPGSKS